ncbi:MAG: deoxyribose-phosphate aldolase, partial [Bacteroidales bacterium]|nr:deoxyribose-phosphate aldolase [Bacteroidales bacterium]
CGRKVVFKVILETGLLVSHARIAAASFLAMEEGADFIKTSTGKVSVNATPMAAYIMCECIKAFYEKTGRMVGFKAAGGISTAMDAVCYYSIVNTILGKKWLNKDYFRFGVSRLANSLLSEIEKKTVSYF